MLNMLTVIWLQLLLASLGLMCYFNPCFCSSFLSARSPVYVKISCLLLTNH